MISLQSCLQVHGVLPYVPASFYASCNDNDVDPIRDGIRCSNGALLYGLNPAHLAVSMFTTFFSSVGHTLTISSHTVAYTFVRSENAFSSPRLLSYRLSCPCPPPSLPSSVRPS